MLPNTVLPRTTLDRSMLGDREQTLEREWLLANGIGGFAGASLSGANTRRYHGLLVAALQPPLDRTVLLGKLDEEVDFSDGQTFSLAVNEWRDGSASLDGLKYLSKFEQLGTLPTFSYQLGPATLTKTIWLEHGQNTVYVRYNHLAEQTAPPLELRVRPLANCRDYHAETRGSIERPFKITAETGDCWQVEAWPEAPVWRLLTFERPVQWRAELNSGWYWGFHYRQEAARGQVVADEDMYCLGSWVTSLAPGQSVTFVASTHPVETVRLLYNGSLERELDRQSGLLAQFGEQTHPRPDLTRLAQRLALAADQFVVGRPDPAQPGHLLPDYRTVIAGYHWFSDWGRDTMISLPGLAFVTGRWQEAATVLASFSNFVSQGMLPNRFPDSAQPLGEGDYNTVDATLWYFDAVDKYLTASRNAELGRKLYPVLAGIIEWHIRGTRFSIKVAEDGLLSSGEPGIQLTWMDVKIGEWVVTPRRGKPIEINALWYRAGRIMAGLAGQFGTPDEVDFYARLAGRVRLVFEKLYWYEEGGYFYDNIGEDGQPDASLRPNQAIALAVAPELFRPERARSALAKVKEKLLTPYGLRTLDPTDPAYHPHYQGDRIARDSAYHQGTVWPWPLGPYARAVLQFGGLQARPEVEALLASFLSTIDKDAVGQINEIYEPEPPFAGVGCVAQAWSVSELLEIWQLLNLPVEDA